MNELNLNSLEVKKAIEEHNLKPVKNGEPAVMVGSRKKTPKVEEPIVASVPKKKKLSIELTAPQEARLLRESSNRNISPTDFLLEIVEERLGKAVGATYINAPRLNGQTSKKITAPTNNFGREV